MSEPHFGTPLPVLRVFSEALAREFYVDFLGFEITWTHGGVTEPWYAGARLGQCTVHLSEHFGDACPGAHLRIETSAPDAYAASLRAKRYRSCNPGEPESKPWGCREFTISDPFGNRLTFFCDEPEA